MPCHSPLYSLCPFLSYLNHAVVGLADVLVDGDAADAIGDDVTAGGILDVFDVSADVGIHGGVLKHTVALGIEGAVFENQTIYIAEQLLASEMTAHEAHVLRVPSQIFTVEDGVVDGDVLALPEGILGDDASVVYLHVLAVLEHILRVALESVDIDVVGEHEGIGAVVQLHIADCQPVDAPERLVGIVDDNILQLDVLHLTEELRPVDDAVLHPQVVGVPDGRARARCEIAVRDDGTVDVPPWVLAEEAAIVGLHVLTLLNARLSVDDGDALKAQVVGGEKRSLTSEFFIFY